MAKPRLVQRVGIMAKEERERGLKEEKPNIKAEYEEEEDDDCFFESLDRVPSRVSFCLDLPTSSSSDEDDEEDDPRMSFASAAGGPSDFRGFSFRRDSLRLPTIEDGESGGGKDHVGNSYDYDIWLAEPISVQERRRRLLYGMGLASSKELAAALRTVGTRKGILLDPSALNATTDAPPTSEATSTASTASTAPLSPHQPMLARCRSDTQLERQRGFITSGPALLRSSSSPASFSDQRVPRRLGAGDGVGEAGEEDRALMLDAGGVCLIKNLDTGKEFVVRELGQDGTGQLNDPKTGLKFSMEEFEQVVGYSPVIKEVMRRVSLGGNHDDQVGNEKTMKSLRSKSIKPRSKKKGGWFKNIKLVASPVTWLIPEKERTDAGPKATAKSSGDSSSELMKVRQHGKSHKELTGLYMSQEILAHQGSIWTMKFSLDGQYLASAGEDRIVHVWKVQERNTLSTSLRRQDTKSPDELLPANGSLAGGSDRPPLHGTPPLKKTKKGKSTKRSLPDYIVMPEVIFSLSEKPVCSFEGHLDDVLDLSWSKSQYLLTSSMDKTVRLWDMETKACLKLFAHNDYVTCIQFNPIDDRYFISGSLDAKVRMWSIPARQVVDWTDLHEMVTAVCYTPNGQGAVIGSHNGTCRFYKISDLKLSQESHIEVKNKKKKSQAKKITGFQFAPDSQSEVLITSADSQVRAYDGADLIHKFRGFRNTSSQLCASCTSDGKYVVCASEDSHVYVWKREPARNTSAAGKSKGTTRSHEHFYCKDVYVAIPWQHAGSKCAPLSLPPSSTPSECLGSSELQSSTSPPEDVKKDTSEHSLPHVEESQSISHSESTRNSESLTSATTSHQSGAVSSISDSTNNSSSTTSWGWYNGSNNKTSSTDTANAWGLVVVTAGLGGEIKVYQNFGLPV